MKTKPVIEHADAVAILAACRAEAERLGLKMAIAVADDGGYPILLDRMEGAGVITSSVAIDKARTAAMMGRPTKALADRVRDEPALLRLEPYMPMTGGLPILVDGQCVGGVGLSGGRPEQDEAIAEAGLAAIA